MNISYSIQPDYLLSSTSISYYYSLVLPEYREEIIKTVNNSLEYDDLAPSKINPILAGKYIASELIIYKVLKKKNEYS